MFTFASAVQSCTCPPQLHQWGRELFTAEAPLTAWMLPPDAFNLVYISDFGLVHRLQCWFVTFEVRDPCCDRWWAEAAATKGIPSWAGESCRGLPGPKPSGVLWTPQMVRVTRDPWLGANGPSRSPPSLADRPLSPVMPSRTDLHRSVGSRPGSVESHRSVRRALRGGTLIHITHRTPWFVCIISNIYKLFEWSNSRPGIV